MKFPVGYTLRTDGTYTKTVTIRWGITKQEQRTETMIRDAAGNLLRVEGRAKRKKPTTPAKRLPYRPRRKL